MRQSPGIFRAGASCLIGQLPTLPHTRACSTIGAVGLNFRVRDGNGWDPYATITQKLVGHHRHNSFGQEGRAAGFESYHPLPTTHLPSRILMGNTLALCCKSVSTVTFYGQAERAISNGQLTYYYAYTPVLST